MCLMKSKDTGQEDFGDSFAFSHMRTVQKQKLDENHGSTRRKGTSRFANLGVM